MLMAINNWWVMQKIMVQPRMHIIYLCMEQVGCAYLKKSPDMQCPFTSLLPLSSTNTHVWIAWALNRLPTHWLHLHSIWPSKATNIINEHLHLSSPLSCQAEDTEGWKHAPPNLGTASSLLLSLLNGSLISRDWRPDLPIHLIECVALFVSGFSL